MSKHVLVTGGAGFIGHHLIDHLLTVTDWTICSLDRLDFSGNLNRLKEVISVHPPEVQKRVSVVFHDLKAPLNPQVQRSIGTPDIILHLAAASHVDRSIEFPLEFLGDNTIGTVNVLEYARTLPNLERFLYFSTDEVFGPAPKGVSYTEFDRYNSSNPYSASKAAGEEFCVAYQNTYKMPIIITHTMNVFGERQLPEKFVPMCIRKVRDGETVTIHANKEKTQAGSRFYISAKDVAEGVLFLLGLVDVKELYPDNYFGLKGVPSTWKSDALIKPKMVSTFDVALKCPKFNLVGERELDNLTLAKIIAKAVGKPLKHELVDFHSARPGHDLRYALDGSLMRNLGWVPKIAVDKRLEEMVHWTIANDRWLNLK
jgi:dTDP-glucose 4,6-dehydratase